jgi:hypothetical protein
VTIGVLPEQQLREALSLRPPSECPNENQPSEPVPQVI